MTTEQPFQFLFYETVELNLQFEMLSFKNKNTVLKHNGCSMVFQSYLKKFNKTIIFIEQLYTMFT